MLQLVLENRQLCIQQLHQNLEQTVCPLVLISILVALKISVWLVLCFLKTHMESMHELLATANFEKFVLMLVTSLAVNRIFIINNNNKHFKNSQ